MFSEFFYLIFLQVLLTLQLYHLCEPIYKVYETKSLNMKSLKDIFVQKVVLLGFRAIFILKVRRAFYSHILPSTFQVGRHAMYIVSTMYITPKNPLVRDWTPA